MERSPDGVQECTILDINVQPTLRYGDVKLCKDETKFALLAREAVFGKRIFVGRVAIVGVAVMEL
jgi:hypothetical protein